jgi:hypothetical protein
MAKNDQGWNQWWAQVGISRPSLCTPPCDPPSVDGGDVGKAIAEYHLMPEKTDTINKLIMDSKALTQDEAGGGQPGLNGTIEKARRAARLADYRVSRDMLNKLLEPMIEDFEKSLKKRGGGGTSQRKTKRRKSKRRKTKRRKSKRRKSKTRRRSR